MAYSHVAHNCILGDNVIMANSVNLAGHVQVDDFAIIGGMTAVHQFVSIGAHSFVGGLSRVAKDVPPFVKVAGGGRVEDPAADLAIMAALASSLRERPIPPETLILGEVGLTGDVRQVADTASRLREASRHGFKRALLAKGEGRAAKSEGMKLESVTSVEEAVALAFQPPSRRARGGA